MTLYSLAFTQLARTPYVIHIPENTDRYYLFPILNGYTEVIYSIGTRTPELGSRDYIFLYGNEPVPAYRIHFNDGEYPHAAVFWSVSLYGAENKFPVSSKNGRHKINSHDVNNGTVLKNSDGSLDIYISREEPEDEHERKNWLPSPPDEKSFLLVIRIYWPDDDTLSGKWNAPVTYEI